MGPGVGSACKSDSDCINPKSAFAMFCCWGAKQCMNADAVSVRSCHCPNDKTPMDDTECEDVDKNIVYKITDCKTSGNSFAQVLVYKDNTFQINKKCNLLMNVRMPPASPPSALDEFYKNQPPAPAQDPGRQWSSAASAAIQAWTVLVTVFAFATAFWL